MIECRGGAQRFYKFSQADHQSQLHTSTCAATMFDIIESCQTEYAAHPVEVTLVRWRGPSPVDVDLALKLP